MIGYTLKLSELVANYKPVYPEPYNWDTTLACLLSDPVEKATIDYLVNILRTGEKFREPIVLGVAEFEEDIEVPSVVNGTHRVCAHIITGIDNVYTIEEAENVSEDYDSCLSTEIIFDDILLLENMDTLFDILRSFPLNENIWMEASVSSMQRKVMHLLWDHKSYKDLDWEIINIKVESIIKTYFPDAIFTTKTFVETF